jgi:replicative DNA helicase
MNAVVRFPGAAEAPRLPPFRVEAEQAVLGAILIHNPALAQVQGWLSESDFYRADHQRLYREILSLAASGQPFDSVTLAEMEPADGQRYVLELASTTPSAANIVAYAEIVVEQSRLRQAIDAGMTLANNAYEPAGRSSADVVAMAQSTLAGLQASVSRGGLQDMAACMKSWWAGLLERYETGERMTGLPTPWAALNDLTFGLQPSDLIVVGARPAMGKSVIGFNLAAFTALRGNRVALFSLEMPREQVVQRCVSALGEIPHDWLRSPAVDKNADYWGRLTAAVPQLKAAPLLIDDQAALTVEQIVARTKRAHMQSPLSLVVVDHLHIVRIKGDNPVRELGDVSRALKALAKELSIPVVLLAQLNRGNTGRPDKRPTMADLRASGEIEQDADFVMLPHREDYYRPDPETHDNALELIIGKARNAPAGKSIWLQTRFDIMRLDDWEGSPPKPMATARAGRGRDRAAGFDA